MIVAAAWLNGTTIAIGTGALIINACSLGRYGLTLANLIAVPISSAMAIVSMTHAIISFAGLLR